MGCLFGFGKYLRFLVSLAAILASPVYVFAQRPPGPPPSGPSPPNSSPSPTGASSKSSASVTLQVSVRETTGSPLPASAVVQLSNLSGPLLSALTVDAGTAMFPNIAAGEYDIEVSSAGYKTSREQVSVFSGGTNYTVFVYLRPESEAAVVRGAPGKPVMSPRLQSEVDKAFDKMRRREFDSARAHLEKAAKMAPGNPDVQYLLGILEYTQQHYDVALTKFETAISLFPKHERTLVALGELLLRAGQADRAAESLEKAYLIDGADWRMHFLLAHAYATQKRYEKAHSHAERASELGGERGVPARLLLAQILVAEGETNKAKTQFNAIIRDVPNDSAAAAAKAELAKLEKPAMVAATGRAESAATSLPSPAIASAPELPVVVRNWAPPDVDAKEYVVAPDVTCSVDELLQRTEMRTAKLLANFERFMATEHIEHQQLNGSGNAGPVKTRDFTYLVFIQRPKKGPLFLEEVRDGGENLNYFPTTLATKGLVGLGVFLFDPTYEGDVKYKCEGLGAWRGQPAWQVRFEQRKEVVSRLMRWTNRHGTFPVSLKGRVWIAANTYDLLHLETDLREPVPQIELSRDHQVIDYGPVQFEHGGTSLWLPWYAELYMELRGKRYHHRHTLADYKLFSVDTNYAVSAPKDIR
jgi:tetratricopeptide (TPR) repeat protein